MKPITLTPVEKFVLEACAAGHGSQTIADQLGRAYETVKTHRRSILRKLRAENMAHAVSIAYQVGLLGNAAPSTRMANLGQVAAFHAKTSALDRALGLETGSTKRETLERVSKTLRRPITSSSELTLLTWDEMHELLDELELERFRAA